MLKPNGYEEAKTTGEYAAPETGGHHARILDVKIAKTQTNKDMLVISFDFAENDKQAGYFMNQYKDDVRPEKKWPHGGTNYTVCVDNEGKTSRSYKTFCTSWEHSNNKQVLWIEDDTAWCAQFKNTRIGVVFGKVHSVYQNEEKIRNEMRWFCSDDKVSEVTIPREKELSEQEKKIVQNQAIADNSSFMDIPDSINEELPFN